MTADPHPSPHADDSKVGPHGSMADHGEAHGHDDHAHAEAPTLGPLDRAAWGAGILGLALGLVVAIALAMASGYRPF